MHCAGHCLWRGRLSTTSCQVPHARTKLAGRALAASLTWCRKASTREMDVKPSENARMACQGRAGQGGGGGALLASCATAARFPAPQHPLRSLSQKSRPSPRASVARWANAFHSLSPSHAPPPPPTHTHHTVAALWRLRQRAVSRTLGSTTRGKRRMLNNDSVVKAREAGSLRTRAAGQDDREGRRKHLSLVL